MVRYGQCRYAKNRKCFEKLKPKILNMFGADVTVSEKRLTFYKHEYSSKRKNWFDSVKVFFKQNADYMEHNSMAGVRYIDKFDDLCKVFLFLEL